MHLKIMLSLSLRCAVGFTHPTRSFSCKRPFSSSTSAQCQWPGLQSWRESSINDNRRWGSNGPEPFQAPHDEDPTAHLSSLAEWGSLVLSTSDPLTKSKLSHLAYCRWRRHNLPIGVSQPPDRPARPSKPNLVSSLLLSKISFNEFDSICKFVIWVRLDVPRNARAVYVIWVFQAQPQLDSGMEN